MESYNGLEICVIIAFFLLRKKKKNRKLLNHGNFVIYRGKGLAIVHKNSFITADITSNVLRKMFKNGVSKL